MSVLTHEASRDGTCPIIANLAEPGVYQGLVNLAIVIEQHIRAMPLEAMAARADDECGMAILSFRISTSDLRRTRDIVRRLTATQHDLEAIRARYGTS